MSNGIDSAKYPEIAAFQAHIGELFPYMHTSVQRNYLEFGDEWAIEFETMLRKMFGEDAKALKKAVQGYGEFALDALRLQKQFERDKKYVHKTYVEVANAVYHNSDYMEGSYLPGNLISHYLWPHHYRQKRFFEISFLKDFLKNPDQFFFDVGIGTGMYSRLLLEHAPSSRGKGFDISESSRSYAIRQVAAFGYSDRYQVELRDIVSSTPDEQTSFLVSVEVLEHLEDPQTFLHALRGMLRPGGKAFITAAITAPNADHIYLYNNSEEVIEHLHKADLKLEQALIATGYRAKENEPVPIIGAYVVT